MPEATNTSPETGATPPSGTPATGNNAPSGATPEKAALTLEEALKRLVDLEHSNLNAKEEVERHRKKLTAYEQEREAAKKATEEAQLSEIERSKKQYAELQAQHTQYQQQMQARVVRYEVERQATKLGIIDPDAAAKLLNYSELEYDEDGSPKNADKLLEKLIKNKPYLAPPAQQQQNANPTTPTTPNAPTIPAMNPPSGRSTIPAPNTLPPGQAVQLHEVFTRRRP